MRGKILCNVILIFMLFYSFSGMAENVNRVVVEGNTVLSFDNIIAARQGDMNDDDIQMLAARITDEYLRQGYLLSHVDDIHLTNGVLRIHVREARIVSVRIDGVEGKDAEDLAHYLVPESGIVYHIDTMDKRKWDAMRHFNLEKLDIEPGERPDGGVRLLVTAKQRGGEFYGGISLDLFYGISPMIGYITPIGPTLLDMSLLAGIRSTEIRRVEGRIYSYFGDLREGLGYFAGVTGYRTVDRWENRSLDYTVAGGEPEAGMIYRYGFMKLTAALRQRELVAQSYTGFPGIFHETRLWGSMTLEGGKRRATGDRDELVLSAFGGWNNLTDGLHAGGSLEGRAFLSPVSRIYFVPWINIYMESSAERFFSRYVFDMDLPGFFDDYTASRFKNITGCALDIEIMRNRFFMGPLIAGGLYMDEDETWRRKSGTGVRGYIVAEHITVSACYAWDIVKNPTNGGLYLSLQGTF